MTDQEGFIEMLEAEDPSTVGSDVPLFTLDDVNGPGQELVVATEEDWQDDPVSTKLEKIRSVFLNSKTAAEVRAAVSGMPVGLWLDHVAKLMPKDVKVSGGVGLVHMLADLGPINKEDYRPKRLSPVESAADIILDVD